MEEKRKYKSVILWLILYAATMFAFYKFAQGMCGHPNCADWDLYPGDRVAGCEQMCVGQ